MVHHKELKTVKKPIAKFTHKHKLHNVIIICYKTMVFGSAAFF